MDQFYFSFNIQKLKTFLTLTTNPCRDKKKKVNSSAVATNFTQKYNASSIIKEKKNTFITSYNSSEISPIP